MIFHDATQRLTAASRASTLDELKLISGVGETKLVRFRQQILVVRAKGDVEPHSPYHGMFYQ